MRNQECERKPMNKLLKAHKQEMTNVRKQTNAIKEM
jgi:hypothetical protein